LKFGAYETPGYWKCLNGGIPRDCQDRAEALKPNSTGFKSMRRHGEATITEICFTGN